MAKEVHPLDQNLLDNYKAAKMAADLADRAVLEAQYAIFESVKDKLPEKGTTHFEGLKITTGFYEKYDQDILQELKTTWKANVPFPFKEELKPDGTAIKYVKENIPGAYKEICKALTLTDKKPSFSLENE